jgi:TorA maturation chaperone TorD
LQVDWDVLERIFGVLGTREEGHFAELRYLLALLLVRKRRLLLVRATRVEQGEALVLRKPRRQEEQIVRAFDLPAERMDELRAELQKLFEGGEELAAVAPATES